jgi:hypothetical protein
VPRFTPPGEIIPLADRSSDQPASAAIFLDSGCCPCPQSCGCAGLYSPYQFSQGPGATDAQAAPYRRLPFAKLDFTITYAPPSDLYVYYYYTDPITGRAVGGRPSINLAAAIGVTETLSLNLPAYNASYPTPVAPPNPTLIYASANYYTDGTFQLAIDPIPGSYYEWPMITVRRDFILSNGWKAMLGFNLISVGCQSIGQATNGYPDLNGVYLFPPFGIFQQGSALIRGGVGVSGLKDAAGSSVPTYFQAVYRNLAEYDWYDYAGWDIPSDVPIHAARHSLPGIGFKWLFHD